MKSGHGIGSDVAFAEKISENYSRVHYSVLLLQG